MDGAIHVHLSGRVLLVVVEAVTEATAESAATAFQGLPSEENEAQRLKIDHRVLSPPRQGSVVHLLTKAAHQRMETHLLVMATAMVVEGRAEALISLQGTAMIALKLMGAAAATVVVVALGMMTGAPLKMMITIAAHSHLK